MKALADDLPFWHFDNDLMVYSDGSLGGGFKLSGYDISCVSPEEINRFSQSIENMLTSTEDGLKLQVFYNISDDLSDIIDSHIDVSKEACKAYQPIAKARERFFQKKLKTKQYFRPEIYFFVRSAPFTYKKQGLFEKDAKYKKLSLDDYQGHKEGFLKSLNQVESSLRSTGLGVEKLSSKKWFEVCFQFLNFQRAENIASPSLRGGGDLFSESLNSQLCLTDMSYDKGGVKIGEYIFRVVSLKTLPEGQTFASMIDSFTKLSFHFWITQNIHILDQAKEKAKLELQRRIAHSMAAGSKNVSDLESENKLAHIEGLLRDLLEGSLKLLSQDFSVIVWGKSKKEVDHKCDEILKAYRSLNQAEGLMETLPAKDAFLKALPGACEGFRHKKMKSSNIAHFMPLYSYWAGNKRPICLLPNRDNGLFGLDPFNPELPNWNGITFGGSGSGKSFTICQLALMFAGLAPKTPRIIFIDNGRSSERLVEVLEGEFLDFKLDSGMCLNMFDLSKGETKPSPEKIKLILAVLELILKDEQASTLPKRQKSLLEEAIYQVYEQTDATPTLSDLKKILQRHELKEMQDYAKILYSWTGDTAYGKLLDGKTNVEISKDVVTIEVQSLNNYSDLKDVILLLLTSYIQETSSADFERPYLLIVDEAERLFQTELAKQFVITCYRTWRKFNSAIWCLSQNYKDFMQDKNLRDSLLPNTTHLIILRQRKIDWKDFQKTFDFTDTQVEVIKSLEIVKGSHSEFFYLQDEKQTVLVLEPEPLSYWICTSDGNDKVKINQESRENPNLRKIEVLESISYRN